ncbi:MAG: hypothetical protein JWQ73_1285, partial [Variovorax sp.]|nr:hypothetical protein [Variovorax sp.]
AGLLLGVTNLREDEATRHCASLLALIERMV